MLTKSFEEFLLFEKNYSNNTVIAYIKDLKDFKKFVHIQHGINDLTCVNYSQIRQWIRCLSDDGLSSRSINRKVSSLRSFYKFLIKVNEINFSPLENHKSLKIKKKIHIPFSESEIEMVLQDNPDSSFELIRDKLIIELLYTTGMRRSELINLKINDLDFNQNQIKVLGKRNKERYIPIISSTQRSINKYLNFRDKIQINDDFSYLFLTKKGSKIYGSLVYRVVNRYFNKISTKLKKSPHILRHSFATHMLNNGADLNSVKELLGHTSLAATQVYTHHNISELKKVYKNSHPRQKS